jgi:hypothetical protein
MSPKQVKMPWRPPISLFGRAWHSNLRQGKELKKPAWAAELRDEDSRLAFSTTLAMIHTHPFMQEGDVWKTRLAAIKRQIFEEKKNKGLPGVFKGLTWINCECEECVYTFSRFACSRAMSYARSLEGVEKEKRVYRRSHPDFVDMGTLTACMEVVGLKDPIVVGLNEQLERTPEYLNL